MATLPFKRGDSFILDGAVSENSAAIDITGWSIKAQVRYADQLVEELACTVVSAAAGTYRVASAGTQTWPVGTLQADVQYTTDSGQIVSTETFLITCSADVTRG